MGRVKFNSGDFQRAKEIFATIKDRVINPREYEMFEYLSVGYMDLESMQFDAAYENISKALDIQSLIHSEKLPYNILKSQLDVLEPLINFPSNEEEKVLANPKLFWHIYGFIFFLAKHHMEQKKYDHAALLTYRLLEMSVQYLLFSYGIQPSKASFDHLEIEQEELLEKVNEVGRELYGSSNTINHEFSPKRVWEVLTIEDFVSKWHPQLRMHELRDGGNVIFDFGNGEIHKLAVREYREGKIFAFDWYGSYIRFEVKDDGQLILSIKITEVTEQTVRDLTGWTMASKAIDATLRGDDFSFDKEQSRKIREQYERTMNIT